MCKCQEGKAAEGYQLFLRSLELSPDNMTAIHELLRCAYELRRYDDLERVLRGYHQRHPEDREMQYCLAGCLFRAGRKEESKQLAMKVLQVDPAHKGARELLELLHKPQATAGITTAASARVIPEKLETNPQVPPKLIDDVDQRFGVIEDQKRDRKWSEVKQACSEILARSSLRPDQRERAMLMTAEALVLEGNAEEAAPVFAQVLEANPRSARAICGLGALAGHRNAWDEAWQSFQRALEYKPEYDVALAGLAMVMMQRGEGERAWEYFNRAVRANPENLRALLGLIETGYPLRKFAEVETALKNYLDLHPADLDFLYSLAGCYYAQNKLKLARGELEKLMLFSPHDARARELESMITARENRES